MSSDDTTAGDEEIPFEEIEGETELTAPEAYAANLIEWAIERHASDVFLSDSEKTVDISVRRLGTVEIVRRLARTYGHRLQGHFRVATGSDAGEMLRPTEGRGQITTPSGVVVDVRLSSIPTLYGQDVSIRLFDPMHASRGIDDLGLDESDQATMRDLLSMRSGLVLVAGPTGSGKSTSLYAAIRHLNDGTRKIHTLEDPIEHAIPGVMQTAINLRIGLDFRDLLPAVLRHSPDVIMLGEIRDEQTAATAVRAGASGQLVLATIHAKTASEAVDVMLQYGTKPKFLAASLIGVINQRLIRKLGDQSKQRVETDEEIPIPDAVRERLGDTPPQLYRGVSDDDLPDGGFKSLTCLAEIMVIDKTLSDAITEETPATKIQSLAVDRGMLALGEAALLRVLRGETTPAEAYRVTNHPALASLVRVYRDDAKT